MIHIQPFLGWLLNATLIGSLVVCLILLIQKMLGGRLGPRWCHALWLVLVVRMILPWAPSSRLSLSNLIPSWDRQIPSQQSVETIPVQETALTTQPAQTAESSPDFQSQDVAAVETPVDVTPSVVTEVKTQPRPWLVSFRGFLPIIWLAGAVVIGIYLIVSDLALWRIVKRDRPLVNQSMLELFEECKAQMGIQSLVAVVPSEKVRSPGLFGFVRPRLLLPLEMLYTATRQEMRYVFLHELAHLKRYDIYLGWLTSLLQVLHWFNPLIWFAFYRMRADRELACDALVLTQTGQDKSQEYGGAILGLVRRFSRLRPLPAMAGIMESKSQLKRRIAMITQFKNNSYRFSPLAAVLIIILVCISLPDPIRTKASEYSSPESLPPITLRQVWSGPDVDPHVATSPAGQFLSYVDWETGDLAIREIATGKTRRLTNKGNLKTQRLFALYSVISPDDRLVAYSWFNEHGTFSLCLVGIDGSADRTLYTSEDHGVFPVCWSSDSKQVVAKRRKGGNLEIITVSVERGSVGVLKTCEKPPIWDEFCYSPNNRFIVYDFPVEEDSGSYDIGIFDTKNNSETSLIKHPASDRLLGWLSKSDEILFLSDRAGSQDIWAVKIVDGKAIGSPRPITRDIGQIIPQGLTRDGSLFFSRYTRRFTNYIVPFDTERAGIHAGSKKPLLGSNCYPAWSPDGESLAYVTEKEGRMRLHIRNLKIGVERELAGDIGVRSPRWSPDGHFVLFPGFDTSRRDEKDYRGGLYTIDIEKDQATQLVKFPPGQNGWAKSTAEWSLDGKAVFYLTPSGIAKRELDSDRERLLYQCDSLSRALSLSPDGKTLAFSLEAGSEGKTSIVTLPVSGGEPRELCVINEPKGGLQVPRAIVWSPNGNYVLFAKSEEKGSAIWRVDAQGGIPEMVLKSSDVVHSLGVNPNGEEIAYCTYMQEGAIWVMENFLPATTVARSANQPNFRRMRIPNRIRSDAQLSPDGKKIALVFEKKLWIMPRSGPIGTDYPGTPHMLDIGEIEVDMVGFTWSGDGQWIAFNGKKVEEGYQRIYVVSADGGTPRQVIRNNRDVRIVNYRMSLSPHGKILAFSSIAQGQVYIYTIPVEGGVPKRLVETPGREPVFSPDGKTIAYVEDKDLGRGGGGLWTVPADGGTPMLVAEAENASSPVWSPDGDMIAFIDYEMGPQIYIAPVGRDGKPAGEKVTIDCPEGIEGVRRLTGWTPDNEIGAILRSQQEFALYTRPVEGGKVTFIATGGYPLQPRWSPDGQRIYHTNKTNATSGSWQAHAIAYVPAEGGDVSTVPLHSEPKIRLQGYGTGNHISPDGKTIVFAGHKEGAPIPTMYIWTLPIDGGTPRQLTDAPLPFRDWYPCWSPDGRAIAFVRMKVPENWAALGGADIYIISAEGGKPRLVTSESDRVFDAGPVLWSPDGKLLAYFSRDKDDATDGTIKVISPDGGEPQVVTRVEKIYANKEMAWSADSKQIAFNEGNVIKIVSLESGNVTDIKPDLQQDRGIYHLDWSPDGRRFVFAGGKGGERQLWVMEHFLPEATGPAAKSEPMTTVRRIGSNWGTFASLSPDGKYLCDVDWDTENLAVLELATGEVRHVTRKSPDDACYPLESAISPDGKEVAYLWWDPNTKASSLHVVGLDGSVDRLLCEGKYPMPRIWSADGQKILAVVSENDVQQMVWISAIDGSMQHIASFPAEGLGYPGKFDISPDGRFIAYDRLQAENTSQRDVFAFDLINNREFPVIQHPSNDKLLGWAPDGRYIFFTSYRTGTWDAWCQKVADGKPQGFPKLVKQGIGDVRPIGFTPHGSYYYAQERVLQDVFTAKLDLETGAVLSEPMPVRQTGATACHDWSPDGQDLAYCERRPDKSEVIYIRTLATGRERTLADNLPHIRWLRWSLDGRSILIDGARRSDSQGVIFKIDVQTGERTDLVRSETEGLIRPEMSPDGKTLYFDRNDPKARTMRLMARDLESGREKELFRTEPPARISGSALSPDGRQFVLSIMPGRAAPEGPVLKTLSTAGGQPKELIRFNISERLRAVGVTWMPDSRNVIFWKWFQGFKDLELWRIPTEGGEPRRLWLRKALGRMRIHPDGQHVAFYDRSTTRGVWVMENFLPESTAGK